VNFPETVIYHVRCRKLGPFPKPAREFTPGGTAVTLLVDGWWRLTLYEILGVMPGASAEQVEHAYRTRMRSLNPDVIGEATPWIHAAADRARAATEDAWLVLGDSVSRARYDEEALLRTAGTGLAKPHMSGASGSGRGGLLLAGIGALLSRLAPHPAPPRKVTVPDVRGLFAGLGQQVVAGAGLRLTMIPLTARPLPVEGLFVDQTPLPDARVRRSSPLTVLVWHPAANGDRK
jgi:hypothetical protein